MYSRENNIEFNLNSCHVLKVDAHAAFLDWTIIAILVTIQLFYMKISFIIFAYDASILDELLQIVIKILSQVMSSTGAFTMQISQTFTIMEEWILIDGNVKKKAQMFDKKDNIDKHNNFK